MITALELKLVCLILDPGTQHGEAEAGRCKLLESLHRRGLSGHDIVELIRVGADSQDQSPAKSSKPDYGLCRMPFGRSKGQLFMDLAPYELRGAKRWAMSTPELQLKFTDFIRDVDAFLRQQ
jgi:hypothetical protein